MPSFTRPGSSVIDYNAVTGDSVTTAAQKQDIALNDLYTNIVDGTASVKGIVQLGTTAATAALGNHLHTGTYAPAAEGVTNGNTHDHTGGDGAQIAYSGLSGLPTLGTAAVADTGTSAGNVVTLATGAALVAPALLDISGAAAGQIKFPATMNPSADANTLDDYEQGTFSPTIEGSTAAGVGTYTFNFGTYTKIGRLVHVSILMEWTAHTGTGNMRIAGLPFATGAAHAMLIAYANNLTITGVPVGLISGPSSIILMYAMNNGATSLLAMDTAATMYLNFSYYTG